MSAAQSYAVDLHKLEAIPAKAPTLRGAPTLKWLAIRFVLILILAYAILIVLPALFAGRPELAVTFSGWRLWLNTFVPLAFAIWSTAHAARMSRVVASAFAAPDGKPLPASELAIRMEREYAKLTAPGWIYRSFRRGLLMSVVILPVGIMATFVPAMTPGPTIADKFLVVAVFFVGTLLWAVPAAFGIHWFALRSYRRVQREP